MFRSIPDEMAPWLSDTSTEFETIYPPDYAVASRVPSTSVAFGVSSEVDNSGWDLSTIMWSMLAISKLLLVVVISAPSSLETGAP